ncbi:MAG: CPBP family intramembrane metalloprotease [Treponema sp.]|jgi:membrane protease YdiL (CAAX protease family)|nr:CPBP family intramembrane metalloprotease [Treponema sp.]
MYLAKRSIQYIIVTLLVSWIVAGVAIFLFGLRITNVQAYTIFAAAYMLLPAICAIVLQLIHREIPFTELGISFRVNWWWLVAAILPIVIAFLTLGINLLFPKVTYSNLVVPQVSPYSPFVFSLLQIVNSLIAGCTINAFFALGEELGWRGYLLRALQDKRFLFVSLIIGVVWGIWHFPLILLGHNYPQHPVPGVAMMIVFCVLLTPMMIYIVLQSGSVITAAIFHGVLNAIAGISLLFLSGGNDLTNGVTGLAGFIVLILLNIGFYLFDKYIARDHIFTKEIWRQY